MEVAVLKLHVASFIKNNINQPVPNIIDPNFHNILLTVEEFKKQPTDLNKITILARYCAAFQHYDLALELLKLATAIQPQEFKYYYFQAILYFLKQDIETSFQQIEQMLIHMDASEYQIKSFLGRIEPESICPYYIYSLRNLLKEFNLPEIPVDFDIFALAYPIQKNCDNKIIRFFESAYCHFFTHLSNHLEWSKHSTLSNLLKAEYQANQNTAWYHVTIGKLYWILHDREKTDYHFKKAVEISKEQEIIFNTDCGVYTWLSDQEANSLRQKENAPDPFQLETWQWFYADLDNAIPDVSIILGCNAGYFRFFPKMLLSLIQTHKKNQYKTKTVISLALENPSRAQITFLKEANNYIKQYIPNLFLTFGYGLCEYQDAAYFASLRYLWAPELFERYPTQTYIADIDALIPDDFFSKTAALSRNYDFGLRLFAFDPQGNQQFGEPWCIGAGILYLNHTEVTVQLLDFLKLYLNTSYNPHNPSNWCIDQSALAQAYDYYIRPKWSQFRITDIDHNAPFFLSQQVESKEAFYLYGGEITIDNFFDNI